MPLEANTFLGSQGFVENPFTLTNADEEPDLQTYFVPPPFFPSVIGTASSPKSVVVFAPRGGGKTAQKVMIEKKATDASLADAFLCLTYDSFLLPDKFKTTDASVEWHLINVVRLLVTALLVRLGEDGLIQKLLDDEKEALAQASRNFLSDLNAGEFHIVISSLRNWRGKADDIIR